MYKVPYCLIFNFNIMAPRVIPVISPEKVKEMDQLIHNLYDQVQYFCDIELSKMELKGKPVMGDGSTNFARVAIAHSQNHPEFATQDVNVEGVATLIANYECAFNISRQLAQLTLILENNCRLMGSDVMEFANNYYLMVKRKAAKGDSDAQVILNDLVTRYQQNARKKVKKTIMPPSA